MSNSFLHLLFYLLVTTFEFRVETSTSLLEEIRQLTEFLPRYTEFLRWHFLPTWLFVAHLVLSRFCQDRVCTFRNAAFFLDLVLRPVFKIPSQILLAELHARAQHILATVFYALH